MNTARIFRFALLGLMAGAVPVACTVKESKDTCADEEYADCTCPDGYKSQKECNADNDGWKACECNGHEGDAGGASNNGGGGERNGPAGDNTDPGGAGADSGSGGDTSNTGGMPNGTSGAPADAGAGGGGGEVVPAECQNPSDDCDTCVFAGCCDQYVACFNDEACFDEYNDIRVRIAGHQMDDGASVAEVAACAKARGDQNGGWSSGLSQNTIALVNCMAGDPEVSSWDQQPVWGTNSCNNSCFKH